MPRIIPLALALALLLSACAGSTAAPTEVPPAATAATDATAAPDVSGAPVTVTFAAQDFERQVYEPLIEEFNAKNPDMRVRLIPYSELLGGDGFLDVASMTRKLVSGADTAATFFLRPQDRSLDLLRDLAPLIDADAAFARDDYLPGALGQAGGPVFALPQTLHVSLLKYNQDLWARRGLPPPKPDWRWADLIAAAEQLARSSGERIDVYGLADFEATRRALAGELASGEAAARLAVPAAQAQLDDPAVAAAIERVAALVKSGALYRPAQGAGFNPEQLQQLIDSGQAAIWPADLVRGIIINDGPTPVPTTRSFEIGTATLPDLPLGRFEPGTQYIMSAGTEHPEAAWRWLAFLSRQNLASPFSNIDTASQVPARKSLAEQSGYWERLDPEARAAVEAALARQAAAPASPTIDPLVGDALDRALEAVLAGTPTQRALTQAQASLEQQVAQAQLTPTAAPSGPVAVATPAPEGPPPGAQPLTFTAFGFGDDMAQLARAFNQAHPELFVQLKQPSFGGQPLTPASIAETADCFAWPETQSAEVLSATLDLQPLIDADPGFDLGDYPALLLAPLRHGARLAGLPDQVSLRTLTYNQGMFEAAGIDPPRAGWTLDQFLSAAQQLTNGDERDPRYGFASPLASADDLLFFLRMSGVAPTTGSGDALKPNFTDAQVAQAVRGYLELLSKHSPHKQLSGYTGEFALDGSFQLIEEGRVGMWLDFGGGDVVLVSAGGPQAVQKMIAPPPFGQGGPSADDVRASGLFISAKSANPAGCWEWIKFLSSATARYGSSFPARMSVAGSQEFAAQARPGAAEVYAAYQGLLQHGDAPQARGAIDFYWLFRAADRALQGQSLEPELAEAQALTEQYLACVRSGTAPGPCATQTDSSYQGRGGQ